MTTRSLPYDYARCINDVCERRHKCMSSLSGWADSGQSFCLFDGGDGCQGFIDPDWFDTQPIRRIGKDLDA